MEWRSAAKPEILRNMLGDTEQVVVEVVINWEADDLFRVDLYQLDEYEMVTQLIRHSTLRVWHDQIQYKPPRVGGLSAWHQDHPYWPIIQPVDLVSAWVALDGATVENGCMWMVPRCHHWGPHKRGTIGTDSESFAP